MAESMFLDDDEMAALCWPIIQRRSARCAWLRDLGVPHFVRPNGTPCVVRSVLASLIEPEPEPEPEPVIALLPPRTYEGSPLQRYHARVRAITAERDELAAADRAAWAAQLRALAPQRAIERREARAALVRFHVAKRRAVKMQRTPPWADLDAIRAIYAEARRLTVATGTQHHVDHHFPLQGALVSGLHVPGNLKILLGRENSRKKNRFEVCDG